MADILATHGGWRLALFAAAVLLYLLIHATRLPFVAVARVLAGLLRGLDTRLSAAITPPVTATRAGGSSHA